jgi:glycosyltransferase involved in cell wall biosynthesis
MRNVEMAIWRDADLVLYPSEEEAAVVRALEPSVTVRSVTPYALLEPAPGDFPVAPASDGAPGIFEESWIVFVAGFGHPPNADAAIWFAKEVMPSILARVPMARLAIIGSNPPACVGELCGARVSLFANVTDLRLLAWYRRAKVAVVPLLAGAGVKLKTVEAMWHGVPVVVTPAGAQGLPGIDRVVAIETEPAAFAAAVCDLLTDPVLWRRRSAAEIAYARERFSEAAQTRSLLRALALIGLSPPRPPPAVTPPRRAELPVEGCVPNLAMA